MCVIECPAGGAWSLLLAHHQMTSLEFQDGFGSGYEHLPVRVRKALMF